MAGKINTTGLLVFLVVVANWMVLLTSAARPFFLDSVKNSGPSHGGGGHGFSNLGGIKNSGPSPGGNHGFALGGIKVSGPSPGAGHAFTNAEPQLGGIKASGGPSPGAGHGFSDAYPQLGGIKVSSTMQVLGHAEVDIIPSQ